MRRELVRIYENAELPAGWTEVPLREAVRLKRGYSWSKDQETLKPEAGAVPVIRVLNVQEKLLLEPRLFLRGLSAQDIAANAVSKGWVLFVASNGNEDRIGDSVLIEEDMQMVFASFLMAITPANLQDLRPAFLALWLRLHWVHEIFSKTAQKGSGLGNFSWSAVKNLPLRYPVDLHEQDRIVEAVVAASRYVEMTSARSANMRRFLLGDRLADLTPGNPEARHGGDIPAPAKVAAGELELAVALEFCLLEELVSGERLLSIPSDTAPASQLNPPRLSACAVHLQPLLA